jgi:hypothetical protein
MFTKVFFIFQLSLGKKECDKPTGKQVNDVAYFHTQHDRAIHYCIFQGNRRLLNV